MKYRVTHLTEYYYGDLVPLCHNLIRMHPRDTAFQTCRRHELTVDPAPVGRRDRIDYFGNHVTWVALEQPHQKLKIKAFSELDVNPPAPPSDLKTPAWEQVPGLLAGRLDATSLAVREYTFDSPYVPRHPKLADYARASFRPGAPLLACLMDLNERIFKEFTFDSRATTIGTPVLDVLASRRGVCQDFAHLFIGCLRSLGLPARYISGYIATKPPPGSPRLMGVDVSHAWIAAFIPDYGWLDLDPTNGLIPNNSHMTVGWARDYDDLSPVKGVMIGGERHTLHYAVTVEPVVTAEATTGT